jgi:hypothetical protein
MASKKKERLETADGYIRVSRVAGREGEAFISPDVQQEDRSCEAIVQQLSLPFS